PLMPPTGFLVESVRNPKWLQHAVVSASSRPRVQKPGTAVRSNLTPASASPYNESFLSLIYSISKYDICQITADPLSRQNPARLSQDKIPCAISCSSARHSRCAPAGF